MLIGKIGVQKMSPLERHIRVFRPCPQATFKGKHNAVKSKCLVFLSLHSNESFTARELSENVPDASYKSLLTLLFRWYQWAYVSRRPGSKDSTGWHVYRYRIAQRGQDFIENRVPSDLLNDLLKEVVNRAKGQ